MSAFAKVTSALETTAPLGSAIVPRRDVVDDCDQEGEPGAKTIIKIDITTSLSEDNKGLRYRLRRWVASALDLKMPQPRRPLYSKSKNRDVAKLINLEADLAGTDLFQIVQSIVQQARELQVD